MLLVLLLHGSFCGWEHISANQRNMNYNPKLTWSFMNNRGIFTYKSFIFTNGI
ncbi:hypothetical protein IV59_GL001795 [Paucilactobacillus hokkaidonensis]|uniref:Transposase n=1 Tax=Paucilactobacillus hokkaidonensis TaxID=1193095 RepID=A0ABR5Q765_9LACO|nr:hypothetical protein IV59_GL001795 [Paucilactobacillus hokkaidonensis]